MPATLHSLTSKTVDLAIAIDDDPAAITVTYIPHALTPATEKRVQEAASKGYELESIVEMFLPVVSKWDLAMNPGEDPIPLEREALEEVPSSILMLILEAVAADRKPDPKETKRR
jgi:hypothetical protein